MSTDATTSAPPPPVQGERRGYPPLSALRRSRTDRKVVGVAGGLGRWAGVDPLVFRILFVVLTIFGGSGILLYALGWLLVPDDGESESEGQRLLHGRNSSTVATVVAGIVVLVLGLVLIERLAHTGPGLGGLGALIVVVAIIILISRNNRGPAPTQGADPGVPPPAEPGSFGQTPGTAYSAPLTQPALGPADATEPSYAATAPLPPPPGGPIYPTYVSGPPPAPTPPKERSILGRVTFCTALIVVGALIGWNVATGHDVAAVAILASALAVVGIGLVVGAFVGRAHGLIALGIVLSIATSLTAVADDHFGAGTGVGQRHWIVRTVAQAEEPHRLGVGEADIDLTRLPAGSDVDVEANVGVGHVLLTVPADARVVVDGNVGAGQLRLFDEPMTDGTDLHRVLTDDPRSASGTVIRIKADLGLGGLEVRRAAS